MFKLPNFLRPYVGSVVGGLATIVGAVIVKKVPIAAPYINIETVSATVTTWIVANAFKTSTNAKVNPTNAATGGLAATVPASTVNKDSTVGKDVKAGI